MVHMQKSGHVWRSENEIDKGTEKNSVSDKDLNSR